MFAHTAFSSVPAPAFPADLDPATRLPRRLGNTEATKDTGSVCQGPALPDNRGRQFLGRRRIARAGKVRWQSLTGTLPRASEGRGSSRLELWFLRLWLRPEFR